MLPTLFNKMGSVLTDHGSKRASSTESDSVLSTITVDVPSSHAPSSLSTSSTPPTSIGDNSSVFSTSLTPENISSSSKSSFVERRTRRSSVSTYNYKELSGATSRATKKQKRNEESSETESRRRTIAGGELAMMTASNHLDSQDTQNDIVSLAPDGEDLPFPARAVSASPRPKRQSALRHSPRKPSRKEELLRRKSSRLLGETVDSLTKQFTVLGKRGRKSIDGLAKASRELKRLADTKEYAHIDTQPVLHEVWSCGKLVVPENPNKKRKVEEDSATAQSKPVEEEKSPEKKTVNTFRQKIWLSKGLYAGQELPSTDKGKGSKSDTASSKPNSILPLPMWTGKKLLEIGRDFKLPYDVCSPLPPGQPKPDEWRKTTRNRFVGDAAAAWKKSNLFDSFSSKCICRPETGCDDNCQNKIMLYECDDTNCAVGRELCSNRSFADLAERRKGGGKYRIGVEVIKTADRGYGVRTNRCFKAHQIIVEYTGEIITEEECDRRMNEDYKDNECYYLMLFDQNMIIDATTGSIARFVNHSCKPNCRMVKWIVAGKPRMALFAGDRDIMTGEELTYDYNFDPFSAKNVQECRCGSDNCRGILGPRPKDQRATKETLKDGVKNGKRKLKELLGGKDKSKSSESASKKRKMIPSTKLKESMSVEETTISRTKKRALKPMKSLKKSVSSLKRSKTKESSRLIKENAAGASQVKKIKTIKKSASVKKLGAKRIPTTKKSTQPKNAPEKRTGAEVKKPRVVTVKKTSKKTSVLKTYGKNRQTKLGIKNSTLTILPMEDSKSSGSVSLAAKMADQEESTTPGSDTIQVIDDTDEST
ncbi:hypothetical protein F5884DRAFT_486155 [Xylogone sp. PMI_703]|nr:hypothetical protein F5884DRAFT_486155 [Xylogone sp. PMI_703]